MNLIITGGCGFIGSNFIRSILGCGYKKIINVDALTYAANSDSARDFYKHHEYELIHADIRDNKKMLEVIGSGDIVINFAAESHVDNSIRNPNIFLETNVIGTQVLLDVCKEKKVSLFVQISTDEVYGSLEMNQRSSKETDILCPSSPYSASKAAAEMLCFAYMRTFKVPIIITRSSNNFGPYQFPEKIIPLFTTNLMEGKKVPVYGTGGNIRDWIFVKDNCDAIMHVISFGSIGEVYNIGGGNEVTNLELTKKILAKMGKDESSIEYVADRLGHDLRYSLDCSKLRELGWKPKHTFEESISKTVDWYMSNKQWWEHLKE